MKIWNLTVMVTFGSAISACSQSSDSCDDLVGSITHTVTEITGIESASVLTRNTDSDVIEVADQVSGTEFSNLIIEMDLSWVAEQHHFQAPSTFSQSLLSWFVTPAMACTLSPYYEEFQPEVSRIEIHSDSDFNDDLVAGSDLSNAFAAAGMMGNSTTLLNAAERDSLQSARTYSLVPAWTADALTVIPSAPSQHIFTITVTLDNGQAYEIRTPEVLLSGV